MLLDPTKFIGISSVPAAVAHLQASEWGLHNESRYCDPLLLLLCLAQAGHSSGKVCVQLATELPPQSALELVPACKL